VIVRLPQPTDLNDWIDLLKGFLSEGVDKYGFDYDEESARQAFFVWTNNPRTITYFLEHEERIVGCICGITTPHFFNAHNWYYYEHLWVVEKQFRNRGSGIKLFRETEAECKRRGIKHMIMANQKHFNSELFTKMYKKFGFEEMESTWIRKV
jgi:GNAT superfamily N-acetyltransferase